MTKVKIAVIGLSGESIFMNVDKFHKNGETKQAKSLFIEPGGKGYNQAVACCKLGAEVSYLSSVGKDQYGKVCEDYMKNIGINTYFKYKDENTSVATILTDEMGENRVTVYKGASSLLDLNDLESFKDQIKKCDILLVQNEVPYDVLKEAIKFAKLNNVYIILNPAPAVYDLKEIINEVDLLIPNEQEAYAIYNKKIEDLKCQDILNNVIITLGKDGALLINKNIKKYFPAIKTNVVDTTGAGDVFCAAIACKIKTNSLEDAIKFAIKASSKHIEKKHVLDAIPTIKEL